MDKIGINWQYFWTCLSYYYIFTYIFTLKKGMKPKKTKKTQIMYCFGSALKITFHKAPPFIINTKASTYTPLPINTKGKNIKVTHKQIIFLRSRLWNLEIAKSQIVDNRNKKIKKCIKLFEKISRTLKKTNLCSNLVQQAHWTFFPSYLNIYSNHPYHYQANHSKSIFEASKYGALHC